MAGAAALYERALSVADQRGAVACTVRVAVDRAADDPTLNALRAVPGIASVRSLNL